MVRLPAEYQEVEYLESTGSSQWINTNVKISASIRFVIDFCALSSNRARYLMGLYESSDKGSFYLYASSSLPPYFQTAFGTTYSNTTLLTDNERHKFEYSFDEGYLKVVCDSTIILSKEMVTSISEENINIVGYNGSASTSNCRTYKVEIYENDILVRNFIPCYRKSDNEPGMYDTVSGTFYTNSGTGTFLIGNDVSWDTANLLERRRQIILGSSHYFENITH